jgi:succinyl-CoA synthetase alpha subunit
MAIFLNEDSKVIVQGMTGSEGMKHTKRMLASARRSSAASTRARPARRSTRRRVHPGVRHRGRGDRRDRRDVSVIFVPPAFAKDAVIEAIDAEIPLRS